MAQCVMRRICPNCNQTVDEGVAGINAFPNDKDKQGTAWHVCWVCEIARPVDPQWISLKAKPERKTKSGKSAVNWMKHTPYHWQTFIEGERLDYWPTKNKYMFRGEVMKGDVNKFIRGITS